MGAIEHMTRAASTTGKHRIGGSKLSFSGPLVGYCLLAVLIAFHPQSPFVVVILGSPLILLAFAVNGPTLQKAARSDSGLGHQPPSRRL